MLGARLCLISGLLDFLSRDRKMEIEREREKEETEGGADVKKTCEHYRGMAHERTLRGTERPI